jgi:hypothetical protein
MLMTFDGWERYLCRGQKQTHVRDRSPESVEFRGMTLHIAQAIHPGVEDT